MITGSFLLMEFHPLSDVIYDHDHSVLLVIKEVYDNVYSSYHVLVGYKTTSKTFSNIITSITVL